VACCQHYSPTPGGAGAFTVQMPRVTFGAGSLAELGRRIEMRGHRRMALFTDPWLAQSEHMARVRESLRDANIQFDEFSDIAIEPTDVSCIEAAGNRYHEGRRYLCDTPRRLRGLLWGSHRPRRSYTFAASSNLCVSHNRGHRVGVHVCCGHSP